MEGEDGASQFDYFMEACRCKGHVNVPPTQVSAGLFAVLAFIAFVGFAVPSMAQNNVIQNLAKTETASLPPSGLSSEVDAAAPTALPEILNAADVALYRQIFQLQDGGAWRKADQLIKQLSDKLLLGHVLRQRYMHPTAYRSKYKELKAWMSGYADHPGALQVYRLALRRQPKGWQSPKRPIAIKPNVSTPKVRNTGSAVKRKRVSRSRRIHMYRTQNRIKSLVRRERPTQALNLFETKLNRKRFTPARYDQTLAIIARSYYHAGKDDKAFEIASRAVQRSGVKAPYALWWGGLTAWRLRKLDIAADYFERMSTVPGVSNWLRAAAAYWAARANLVNRQPQNVTVLLRRAATAPRSFYGILALRALGEDLEFDWSIPVLGSTGIALLDRIPAAKRALGLLQAGQSIRAGSELKRFANNPSLELTRVLLALSDRANMPDVLVRIGSRLERTRGERYDAALFPLPGWSPEGGYTIDRALIFAFMRQESRFKLTAKSRSGAVGLMQLMPATAGFIARTRYRGAKRRALYDPAHNIGLGQKYIHHLMNDRTIGYNLFFTTTAYNAGPGNLKKWRRKSKYQDDPLLFIESIRSRETRNYVEHVMTNFWAYRLRLKQPTPSLDAVAAGEWPIYIPFDQTSIKAARNAHQR
jgi:soluble lytic murein transglycosylase